MQWKNLIVWDADGIQGPTLGEYLGDCSASDADRITVADDGSLGEWSHFFVAAPGEAHSWDTPAGPVDWTGFREAVQEAALRVEA